MHSLITSHLPAAWKGYTTQCTIGSAASCRTLCTRLATRSSGCTTRLLTAFGRPGKCRTPDRRPHSPGSIALWTLGPKPLTTHSTRQLWGMRTIEHRGLLLNICTGDPQCIRLERVSLTRLAILGRPYSVNKQGVFSHSDRGGAARDRG